MYFHICISITITVLQCKYAKLDYECVYIKLETQSFKENADEYKLLCRTEDVETWVFLESNLSLLSEIMNFYVSILLEKITSLRNSLKLLQEMHMSRQFSSGN